MRPFHLQEAAKKRRRHRRKISKCALSRERPTLQYSLVALRYFLNPRGMEHRNGDVGDNYVEAVKNDVYLIADDK